MCACTGTLSLIFRDCILATQSAADFGEQEEDLDIVTVQDALLTQAPDEPSMVRRLHSATCPTMPL